MLRPIMRLYRCRHVDRRWSFLSLDVQKNKLALLEKEESFLDRTCADARKEIEMEIGELFIAYYIPFCFVWKSPVTCTGIGECSQKMCCGSAIEKSL